MKLDVLAFDVFGTVVDWHGSIVRELAQLPCRQVLFWRSTNGPTRDTPDLTSS